MARYITPDWSLAMINPFNRTTPTDLLTSKLHDQDSFYPAFMKDLGRCKHEVLIESPFLTRRRSSLLMPVIKKLKSRRVKIIVNTRDPLNCDAEHMRDEALGVISELQHLGVQVLYTDNHHRKLAILDRQILWEGSLNILSQNDSCEVMRRIESTHLAWQMARFIGIDKRMN